MKQKRRPRTASRPATLPAEPVPVAIPPATKAPILFRQYRRVITLVCVVLLAATLLAYSRVPGNGFVNDDDPAIVLENNHIKNGLSVDGLTFALTDITLYYWQPLTWISHMLDCQFFGLKPGPPHFENVLLHSVNSVFVFLLLFGLTGRLLPSALCSITFAIHPLQVESVAWISERRNVLSGCFLLLTLLAYVRYTRQPTDNMRRWVVFVLFWLALGSKPIAVILPLLLLLLDHWPLGRLNRATAATLIREKIPLFVSSALIAAVTAIGNSGKAISFDVVPLRPRIAHAVTAYGEYMVKFLKPWPLAHFYPYRTPGKLAAAAAGFALVFIFGIAFQRLRDKPYLLTGWLWFLIGVFPVIGFMQVGGQSIADRFMYIPMIGLSIIVIWLLADLVSARRKLAPVALGLGVAVLAVLGYLSFRQTAFWSDGLTLYRHTLAVTDGNERMWYFYGSALEKDGSTEEAVDAYHQAIRLAPDRADDHEALGALLFRLGRSAPALDEFREVLRLEPENVPVLRSVSLALIQSGATREAAQYLERARRLAPQDSSIESLWRLLSVSSPGAVESHAQSDIAADLSSARVEPQQATQSRGTEGFHALSLDESLQLGILLGLIGVAGIWRYWAALYGRLESILASLAKRPKHAMAVVALLPLGVRLLLLPIYPIPEPTIHDEFGYLLEADTFASGRLANPPHPMKDHFESIFILQSPAYASYYPIGQGVALALPVLVGISPWWGVWLSIGAMCAALYWMLLGWMPPRWALLGALLAALRFGVISHWMNSYWGGAVAAIGGSLVLGSLARIYRRASLQDALVLGAGLGILSQTRPFEGLLLAIPVGVAIFIWLFRRSDAAIRRRRWLHVALPLAAVLVAVGAFTAYYNTRVTGNALQLPYQYYAKQYGVPQSFYWQKPLPPGKSTGLPELAATYKSQLDAYNVRYSVSALAGISLSKLASLWQFFFQPVWTLPLLLVPLTFRDRRIRFLLLACLVVLFGVAFYPFFFPHYLAPISGAIVALVIQGIRRIQLWRPRGLRIGPGIAGAVVAANILCIAIAPPGGHLMNGDRIVHHNTPQEKVAGALHQRGGRHLVIVRYAANHSFEYGLINNAADIDRSDVVWARDLGPEKNQELLKYYPNRTAWSFDADRWPIHLVPYTDNEGRLSTSSPRGVSKPTL